jgi:halocyanin-like protein
MSERSTRLTRRSALQAGGAALAVGLAGCSSGDGGSGDSGPYDGWLNSANWSESVTDATGQASVTVEVGAGGGYAFAPAAVRVSAGTEVVWEWLGRGGSHNVKHVEDEFESELVVEEGHTFSHTFDSAGVYKYVCVPHRSTGMKGVVEVVEG